MKSNCVSPKKIRKGLRSRRLTRVPPAAARPTKVKPEKIQRKSKKPKLDANREKLVITPTKASSVDVDQTSRRDSDIDCIGQPSTPGKRICVDSEQIVSSKPANQNDKGSSKLSIQDVDGEPELSDRTEDHIYVESIVNDNQSKDHRNESDDNQSEVSVIAFNHRSESDDNRSETSLIGNKQRQLNDDIDSAEDSESADLEDNCLEDVLQEVNKDIGALYSKTNKIEADLKEIKQILLARPSQHCIRTISSRFKQKTSFSLLPKLPLKKKSAVRSMDTNAEDEDNEEYKDQLVMKLASYGGDTVNELVINIFKNLFSTKLKTKYCWKGTARGKIPFKRLKGIREAIWSAVTIHFKDCTEATVTKQIKLRFHQAQKEYDRERMREQNGVE